MTVWTEDSRRLRLERSPPTWRRLRKLVDVGPDPLFPGGYARHIQDELVEMGLAEQTAEGIQVTQLGRDLRLVCQIDPEDDYLPG